jgi:excisionase family DNA binding protein
MLTKGQVKPGGGVHGAGGTPGRKGEVKVYKSIQMSEQPEKLLTLKEVAQILGLHPMTVRRYIKADKLTAVIIKGKKRDEYRIPEKALQDLAQGPVLSYQSKVNIANFNPQESLEFKELLFQHQQALVRLGQLEAQRLMLTERAESLQKREEEFQAKMAEKERKLERERREKEPLAARIQELTRKRWWEFWKRRG